MKHREQFKFSGSIPSVMGMSFTPTPVPPVGSDPILLEGDLIVQTPLSKIKNQGQTLERMRAAVMYHTENKSADWDDSSGFNPPGDYQFSYELFQVKDLEKDGTNLKGRFRVYITDEDWSPTP